MGRIWMSWTGWKDQFEGMACLVGWEAGLVCSVAEAAHPAECAGGRVRAFLQAQAQAQAQARNLVSMLIWTGRTSSCIRLF